MSRQVLVGFVLLVAGSVGIGFASGHWFYSLYVDSIPEALKASTSLAGTRVVFLWNGFLLGAVIAVFSLVAVALARFFRPGGSAARGAHREPR